MRVDDAVKLQAGAVIYWRNLTSLKQYAGTISAVTPNSNIQISVPGANPTTRTYPLLGVDNAVDYPFWALS